MIADDILAERITLRILDADQVGERYLGWMRDPYVNQYLESRFSDITIDDLHSFVESARSSFDTYFFAIVSNETGEHLGNIKLGPINAHHKRAAIGLVIGEPSVWGKGIATEALVALSRWAFGTLGLRKLIAGSYAANVGSIRAFEKAGFRIEGRQLGEVIMADGTRGDTVSFGMTSEEAR